MSASLGALDILIAATSILISVLIGLYFGNKNKSLNSYLRADGELSVLPVAVSLMTSCISGITIYGSSSELYYQGPSFSFIAIGFLLAGPITAYTILPVFYRMNELSLYKYLEKRYGLMVKFTVSFIFMLQMICYNAITIYVPALALQTILGISRFYSILFLGIICVVYSGVGGVKAVVWTDFFQAILMYSSVLTVGILGTIKAGGIGRIVELAHEGGRLNLDDFLEIDLTTRHTLFNILVGSTLYHTYSLGVNQVQIQRALSLNTLKQAKVAFIICSVLACSMSVLSTYMGLVVYAAYRSCDPYLGNQIGRRDILVLHYVQNLFKDIPGLRGLFIAGIFSATLSTLSSFANSMAALALDDFILPIRRTLKSPELSSGRSARLAKVIAVVFGTICVSLAYTMERANSRLLQAVSTLFSAFGVPFLGIFTLGIFTRYANSKGVLTSLVLTLTFGIYMTIEQTFLHEPLEPAMPIRYDQQCSSIFNMTTKPDSIETMPFVSSHHPQLMTTLTTQTTTTFLPFKISQVSYMNLPIIQFFLTILIGSIASLLTGGWKQDIADKYLVKCMHRNNSETSTTDHELDGMSSREEK